MPLKTHFNDDLSPFSDIQPEKRHKTNKKSLDFHKFITKNLSSDTRNILIYKKENAIVKNVKKTIKSTAFKEFNPNPKINLLIKNPIHALNVGILKESLQRTQGYKETAIYELATICKLNHQFVYSERYENFVITENNSCIMLSGVIQPYLNSPSIKKISDDNILEGKLDVPFSTILEAVITELQFSCSDAISENLRVDLETEAILHFDLEADMPDSNSLQLDEGGECSIPPFKSVLLGHPTAFEPLSHNDFEKLQMLVKQLNDSIQLVRKYFSKKNHHLDNLVDYNRIGALTAWEERTRWMTQALEPHSVDSSPQISLVEFALLAHPEFKFVKYHQIAADLIWACGLGDSQPIDLEKITTQKYTKLVRKAIADLGVHSNYMVDINEIIEEYDAQKQTDKKTGTTLARFIQDNLKTPFATFCIELKSFLTQQQKLEKKSD